jgi:transketolase
MTSKNSNKSISIRQSFGETVFKLAKNNKDIFVVSMDLKSALYLNKFAKCFPKRFIESGVAEANAAGIAAGLAKTGKTVFLCSFSCFSPSLNWAVIKQSICYNNLKVIIIGSHSGLMSGDLGASHQMLEDVALMSTLPNMEVFAPLDAYETQKIVTTASRSHKPAYIRLVRPQTDNFLNSGSFTIGKSQILQKGKDVTIVGYGPILLQAFEAQKNLPKISLEIINCSSIKPLDAPTILKSVKKTGSLICLEDHQKNGGLGQMIASLILESNVSAKFIHLGVDNKFGQSAKNYQKLYDYYSISTTSLITAIKKNYGK